MPPRHQQTDPTPAPDLSPEASQVPGPMFRTPDLHPGRWNPDPAPPGDDGASGSSASPALTLTPAELSAAVKGKGRAYAKIAKAALHAVGGLVNMRLAVDDDDKCFLPDEDDDDTIAPPLGRIAARKIRIGANADDLTDIEDIGIAVVGLVAWVLKGASEHLTARRERGPRGNRKGGPVFDGTGQQGGEPGMEQQ